MVIIVFLSDESVYLKSYEATLEGYIESWMDRFSSTNVCDILELLWNEEKKHFPSTIDA